MARGVRPASAGKFSNFKIGNKTALVANANPTLNKSGMLWLLKIGMVIKIEPTRIKMRKNICSCGNGIETDIISTDPYKVRL
jgi:hypothetical protein